MNRTNGASHDEAWRMGFVTNSADARADPACHTLKGGCVARFDDWVWQHHIPICCCAAVVCLLLPGQTIPNRRFGEGRERPPLFCRSIGKQGRGSVAEGVAHPAPPFWGRSRPIDPYGKVPNQNPQRTLTRRRHAP